MKNKKNINIRNSIMPEEVKDFRHRLGMSQVDCAKLLGISRATMERMESGNEPVKGPVAALIDILMEEWHLLEDREIPAKKYPLRMWYMYNEKKCTLIDVDDILRRIEVRNYTSNILFRAFGSNDNPSYEDYKEFLESRCFPNSRDKIKIELDALGLPFYDPFMIIEKTEGRMAEDNFWIYIER